MVDLTDKELASEEIMSSDITSPERGSPETCSQIGVRTCADCGTSKTPLWRGGPAGPKSLCNACGIRSRKKRRALLGLNKQDNKKSKKSVTFGNNKTIESQHNDDQNQSCNSSSSSSGDSTSNIMKNIISSSLKNKLLPFGKTVILQRPRSRSRSNSTQRRKLGEVEQAAFLLMALSCGSVYG